jgi:hypothetical protein
LAGFVVALPNCCVTRLDVPIEELEAAVIEQFCPVILSNAAVREKYHVPFFSAPQGQIGHNVPSVASYVYTSDLA